MPSRTNRRPSPSEEPSIELPEDRLNDETTILPALRERTQPTNGRYDLAATPDSHPEQVVEEEVSSGRSFSSLATLAKATAVVLVVLAWISAFLLAIRSI